MSESDNNNTDLESIVEVTDAILRGDFDKEADIDLDAKGMLASLVRKINQMVVNMKKVEVSLSSAGERTPLAVDNARNVLHMMSHSTEEVLSKADILTEIIEELDPLLREDKTAKGASALNKLENMKAPIYDIIASQSYQDVARQQMEALAVELNQIRDWLIETLVVLNINKDASPEDLMKKKEILQGVKQSKSEEPLDQDLVDDLLSEFGF